MDQPKESYENFIDELKDRTRTVHDKSDKLVNLKLAVVLTDKLLYGNALHEFYNVFLTIDSALRKNKDNSMLSFANVLMENGISRAEHFEKDMEFFLGHQWRSTSTISKPCQIYCDRILQVGENEPILMIAYVHTMYMALLAGGQILKKIISKSLGIDGSTGLSIFEFYGISQAELKYSINDAINSLTLDRDTKDKILLEKIRIFQMNDAITENIKVPLRSYSRIVKLSSTVVAILIFCIYLLIKLYFMISSS